MKREAYRHPKMFELAARLGVSRATAIGIVQLLLDYTADAAPQGNIGKWANGTIARACEWSGDENALIDALIGAGWLDVCAQHRLVIHDLEDHAERWWQLKLQKLGLPFIAATVEPSVEGTVERSTEATIEHSILPSSALLSSALPTPCGAALAATLPSQPLLPALDPGLEQAPASSADSKKKNPPKKPEKLQAEDLPLPPELDTPAFIATWREWIKFRRSRRHSTDEVCMKRQLRDLAPLGAITAVECLKLALASGYQGLPIRRFQHGKQPSDRLTGVGRGQRFAG